MAPKVAIVATHPIQYYAPWFRFIAEQAALTVRVFYLWDFGVKAQRDPGFERDLQWDVPLLSGYEHEFVPNTSGNPGTHRFFGLLNPTLVQRLKAFAPDAVLLLGYNHASLMRLIFSWPRTRAPLVFRGDSHLIGRSERGFGALRRAVITRIFKRFAAVLYVGAANRAYFRYHGVPERKLFHSPHAIDTRRFLAAAQNAKLEAVAWRRELGIPDGDAVVLYAGKWEPKKRPEDLLSAFLEIAKPNVSLLFVGDGVLEVELRRRAAGHAKVFFAGFQNQSLMPRTYCSGDVFVLPSLYDETWGLAVNEAMCMARAVIVSDRVGCAQDLVQPRVNGLVFPAGDVPALAAALQEALADRERLRAWGAAGREIIQGFDYARATQGLIDAVRYLGLTPAKR
jgi:glycosyltransferase involved in cell wall biosynthesis